MHFFTRFKTHLVLSIKELAAFEKKSQESCKLLYIFSHRLHSKSQGFRGSIRTYTQPDPLIMSGRDEREILYNKEICHLQLKKRRFIRLSSKFYYKSGQ